MIRFPLWLAGPSVGLEDMQDMLRLLGLEPWLHSRVPHSLIAIPTEFLTATCSCLKVFYFIIREASSYAAFPIIPLHDFCEDEYSSELGALF
jgi:hypothetical protein